MASEIIEQCSIEWNKHKRMPSHMRCKERKERTMEKIKLKVEHCKGCYLCVANCRPGALRISNEVNAKGYLVPEVDQEKCVQCGCCYTMCPDLVFEIL